MKTKRLLSKIVLAGFLISLIIIVVMSCKKKDDTPEPTPPPVPVVPPTPNTFSNKIPKIMSDYEKARGLNFPAHEVNAFGNGLQEGLPGGALDFAMTLFEIHEYYKTEANFKNIDEGLAKIQNQIDTLQTMVTNLGVALKMDVTKLEDFATTGDMDTYFGYVRDVMDSSTANGFRFYTQEGMRYQAQLITQQQMNADTLQMRTFAEHVYNKDEAFDVTGWVTQFNELICPSSSASSTNALTTYADEIIQKATPLNLQDSASMMNLYMLLEAYFLQVINNQFQCANVWSNACNLLYPSFTYGAEYYKGTFATDIKNEVNAFLSTTNYLVVNLNEYRYADRFNADMQYANAGLAPDNLFFHVLARSQFVANLIYDALGLSYPVMCGSIVTPWNYTNGHSPIITQLTINSNKSIASTAQLIKSQLPYTFWMYGSRATCGVDNQWNFYRFGALGSPDPDWPSNQNITLQINDNDMYTPWAHTTPIKGNTKTLFYNPQNPDQTSEYYNNVCTIQFGYFSANWMWGYLYLSDFHETNWQHTDNFAYFMWVPGNPVPEGKNSAPCVASTNGEEPLKVYPHGTAGATFSYPQEAMGILQMTGTTVETANYYIAADCINHNAIAANDPAGLSNSELQLWMNYAVNYTAGGSKGVDIWIRMGSDLQNVNPQWMSNGDVIGQDNFHNLPNYTCLGFGKSGKINRNSNFSPSIQYYYMANNIGAIPLTIQMTTASQMVYSGYFPLSR